MVLALMLLGLVLGVDSLAWTCFQPIQRRWTLVRMSSPGSSSSYNSPTSRESSFNTDTNKQGIRLPPPSRNDHLKVLATGVIGTEPKETYLSNGHYVLSFSVSLSHLI